jgi:hypothetical protein
MESARHADDAIMAYREAVGKSITAYREEIGKIIHAIPPQISRGLWTSGQTRVTLCFRSSATGAHSPLLGPQLLDVSVVLQPIATIRVPSRSTSGKR